MWGERDFDGERGPATARLGLGGERLVVRYFESALAAMLASISRCGAMRAYQNVAVRVFAVLAASPQAPRAEFPISHQATRGRGLARGQRGLAGGGEVDFAPFRAAVSTLHWVGVAAQALLRAAMASSTAGCIRSQITSISALVGDGFQR